MKQYINKDALVTEIKRLAEVGRNNANSFDEHRKERAVWLQQADVCDRILSFIENLEVKEVQEEPVSEVEKAAKRYATEGDEISGLYIIDEEVDAFKAGAKWQKEQMLKKSFGATVCKYLNTFLKEMDKDAISQALREYTNGDRVRVLIIKQE